jgi:hypothetical protein
LKQLPYYFTTVSLSQGIKIIMMQSNKEWEPLPLVSSGQTNDQEEDKAASRKVTVPENQKVSRLIDVYSLDDYTTFENEMKPHGILVCSLQLPFPLFLHTLLENVERAGNPHIFSWNSEGNAFKIHDTKLFCSVIMSQFCPGMSHIKSFYKQLALYGLIPPHSSWARQGIIRPS